MKLKIIQINVYTDKFKVNFRAIFNNDLIFAYIRNNLWCNITANIGILFSLQFLQLIDVFIKDEYMTDYEINK